MSSKPQNPTKNQQQIDKATKRFVKEWGSYAMSREALELSRDSKIKANPGVYHNLVAWAEEFCPERIAHSREGIGDRVLDDLELNMLAPGWYDTAKPTAYHYARKGLSSILQGLDDKKLKPLVGALPAPENPSQKYASFAKLHTHYQEVKGAVEAMTSNRIPAERKSDLFEQVLHPLAAKIIQLRMARKRLPNKQSLPHAGRLADTFAYIAKINPSYALSIVQSELPKIEKKFNSALDQMNVAQVRDYFKEIHRGILGVQDDRTRQAYGDQYFDNIYKALARN